MNKDKISEVIEQEIIKHQKDWKDSLDHIKANKDNLRSWWFNLLSLDNGVDSEQMTIQLNAMESLLEMNPSDVEKMWRGYNYGEYTNDEILELEARIHLFKTIVDKNHNLW
jgi:hypothetical protein